MTSLGQLAVLVCSYVFDNYASQRSNANYTATYTYARTTLDMVKIVRSQCVRIVFVVVRLNGAFQWKMAVSGDAQFFLFKFGNIELLSKKLKKVLNLIDNSIIFLN